MVEGVLEFQQFQNSQLPKNLVLIFIIHYFKLYLIDLLFILI